MNTGPVKDFQDAPTQYGSAALALSPVNKLHSNIGYRISSVNGSRLFTDARDVNGSLVSTYQTPFVNVAWTIHKGMIWKAEYDYYGYGEGGRSGAQWCSTSTTIERDAGALQFRAEYRDVRERAGLRVHRTQELPRE